MKGIFRIKILKILLFTVLTFGLFAFGCSVPNSTDQTENRISSKSDIHIIIPNGNEIVAIYLAPKNGGVLSDSDLKGYPEILKVTDFEAFTTYTSKYIIPIWIDKDAIYMLPQGWINKSPQKFHPIIVVGYGNALYAMRDKLGLPIHGPRVDWSKQTLEPGFSFWMIKTIDEDSISSTLNGYLEEISVPHILEVSNDLFAECFKTLKYSNTQYDFNFYLPLTWSNYKVIEDKWIGYKTGASGDEVAETGPMIFIRNPQWREKEQTQDIPIMIFAISQWDALQQNKFNLGAAPIGPTELGRNSKYVFALPARYNFAFPKEFEIVDEIIQSNPLEAF